MPFSLKKQLKTIKHEFSKFLPSTPLKSSKSHKYADESQTTFRNIRNDLRCRNRYKDEKNAYRDYSKICDKILLHQNNCALRCAQEKKVSNLCRSECLLRDQEVKEIQAVEESSHCDNKTDDDIDESE